MIVLGLTPYGASDFEIFFPVLAGVIAGIVGDALGIFFNLIFSKNKMSVAYAIIFGITILSALVMYTAVESLFLAIFEAPPGRRYLKSAGFAALAVLLIVLSRSIAAGQYNDE